MHQERHCLMKCCFQAHLEGQPAGSPQRQRAPLQCPQSLLQTGRVPAAGMRVRLQLQQQDQLQQPLAMFACSAQQQVTMCAYIAPQQMIRYACSAH